tara:strand:+ start:405 stop:956 length:552 start_codon:yes stop_codon:yes gene_type:complete
MQIVSGYNTDFGPIRLIQQFRLYHLSRPAVKKWRVARHGIPYKLDVTDRWILDNLKNNKLVAVDCAGWYFREFDITPTCLESDMLSKQYFPECYVEPDILTHRPTYISADEMIVFKFPWFLKYATLAQFVNFLNVWVKSVTVINFYPILIQHNHLKFTLDSLVKEQVNLDIKIINPTLWVVSP